MTHYIIDCDGVLLDWVQGFREWVGRTQDIYPSTPYPDRWTLGEWLGVTDFVASSWIGRFNASFSFGLLKPMPGAVEAVARLVDEGHTVTVLTSCSDDPETVTMRVNNLKEHFGETIARVVCLPLQQSKETWLSALRNGIWIEDNYRHCEVGLSYNHICRMIRQTHNRDDEARSDPNITWHDNLLAAVTL